MAAWTEQAQRQAEKDLFESLHQHKLYVFEAGLMVGGIPLEQLYNHDASKFWPEEFPHYARQFHGDRGDPDGFAAAWLHHIHYNPHHWQHWMFPHSYQPRDKSASNRHSFSGRILPMPEIYVREMVADWLGAGMTYAGSWDLTTWLQQNLPKIQPNLHPETQTRLRQVLLTLDYGHILAPLPSS